jgi:hypothetical protein
MGGFAMQEEMIIQTRTFDLMAWLLPKAETFPRAYRNTVTQRMMETILVFQELLIVAQSQRGHARQRVLLDCDAKLNQLRVYLRLAHRWHWFSDGQYAHVSQGVAELGRLLGGWLNQEKGLEK